MVGSNGGNVGSSGGSVGSKGGSVGSNGGRVGSIGGSVGSKGGSVGSNGGRVGSGRAGVGEEATIGVEVTRGVPVASGVAETGMVGEIAVSVGICGSNVGVGVTVSSGTLLVIVGTGEESSACKVAIRFCVLSEAGSFAMIWLKIFPLMGGIKKDCESWL